MFCATCEQALREIIEYGKCSRHADRKRSMPEFHSSLVQGCEICNQLWKLYIDDLRMQGPPRTDSQQRLYARLKISTVHVPIRFSDFEAQIESADMLLRASRSRDRESNFSMRYGLRLNPDGVDVEVDILQAHTSLLFLIASEAKLNSVRYQATYNPSIHAYSTAAMPRLWNKWLKDCLDFHHECGHATASPFTPRRLVEIMDNSDSGGTQPLETYSWRLKIMGETRQPYLTLSHCWGKGNYLKLTSENLDSLCESWHSVSKLPKTYHDAIQIVRNLNCRHIWIDSLCIVQDDTIDWQEQSSLMGRVYSGGVRNIAAASSKDGDQGCFKDRNPYAITSGVLSCRSSPEGLQNHKQFTNTQHEYESAVLQSPLNKRGWVLQEYYLSPRQLSFGEEQVYWECGCIRACEKFPDGDPLLTRRTTAHSRSKLKLNEADPVLLKQSWSDIVQFYSTSALTRRTDKTVAIAGLASEYQRRMDDVYLQGLWKRDILKELLWMMT